MAYKILHKSTPASPHKDVKMTSIWRIAHYCKTLQQATAIVNAQPDWKQVNYKIVKAG